MPIQPGLGVVWATKRKFGIQSSFSLTPLNFNLDYGFDLPPDETGAVSSQIQMTFLSIQSLMEVYLFQSPEFQFSAVFGHEVHFRLSYKDATTFASGATFENVKTDDFEKDASNLLLGLGGRYFGGDHLFVDVQVMTRFLRIDIDKSNLVDYNRFNLGTQLGLGWRF